MKKILGSIIYLKDSNVIIAEVSEDMWCEIDDVSDLERANKKFAL